MSSPGHPSKFNPRTDCKMLKEVFRKPKISSKDLQVAPATVNVKVHVSTISTRPHNFDIHGTGESKTEIFGYSTRNDVW